VTILPLTEVGSSGGWANESVDQGNIEIYALYRDGRDDHRDIGDARRCWTSDFLGFW